MAKIKDGLSNEFSYDIKKWGEVKKGYTHFANGDIGFAKITPCFENKKSVVFTKLKNGIGAGTTELFILRPYISRILPDFILAYVKRDAFISAGIKSFNGAVGQQRVPSEFVKNSLFPLPSTDEQARIVEKLKISIREVLFVENENNSLLKKIERTRSKLLDLAIQGKLLPQNSNDEPASALLERIRREQESTKTKRKSVGSYIFKGEDNLYYEKIVENGNETIVNIDDEIPFCIPESWAWTRLGTLVSVISGVSYQKSDVTSSGIRILRGGNLKYDARICLRDDDVFLSVNYANKEMSVKKNDVIIVASTGSSTVIGRPAIASENMNHVQIGAFLRIVRSKNDAIKEWLPIIFLGNNYRYYIRKISKGTNIKNLKAEYISNFLISIPPLEEQKRIVEYISKANNQLDSILSE